MNTDSNKANTEKKTNPSTPTNSDNSTKKPADAKKKIYAQIPLQKVFFMTVVSLGLYIFVWLHRNWRIFSIRNQVTIRTWVRSLFFPITCYSLFKDMSGNAMTAAGFLALQWIPLAMYYAMPTSGYLTLFTQAAIFTYIQHTLNHPHDPAQENKRHYKFNTPCIIVSALSILLFILVMFRII
jgi:hypothetical protein